MVKKVVAAVNRQDANTTLLRYFDVAWLVPSEQGKAIEPAPEIGRGNPEPAGIENATGLGEEIVVVGQVFDEAKGDDEVDAVLIEWERVALDVDVEHFDASFLSAFATVGVGVDAVDCLGVEVFPECSGECAPVTANVEDSVDGFALAVQSI